MPSKQTLEEIEHFADVRARMTAAGFANVGEFARLTRDEMNEQYRGFVAGVSSEDVAEQFIARRRLAMADATVAA